MIGICGLTRKIFSTRDIGQRRNSRPCVSKRAFHRRLSAETNALRGDYGNAKYRVYRAARRSEALGKFRCFNLAAGFDFIAGTGEKRQPRFAKHNRKIV